LHALHSFPTRRSSDLSAFPGIRNAAGASGSYGMRHDEPLEGVTTMNCPIRNPIGASASVNEDAADILLAYTARRLDPARTAILRSEEHTSELQSVKIS